MLPVQLQAQEQAASAALSPCLHTLRILRDYYTSVSEVFRIVQAHIRTSQAHSERIADTAPSMSRVDDGVALPAYE
jgi:hypothetical protein